jgi:hypothetical protein
MWLFWNIPINTPAYEVLILHRWYLVLYSISGLSMGIDLVRTYKHSQYPYIYTCTALMFASAGFNILGTILYNWNAFCP